MAHSEPTEFDHLQRAKLPRGCMDHIFSYAGDPTLPNTPRTYQLILEAYQNQGILSRFRVIIPTTLDECEACVNAVFSAVMELAQPQNLIPTIQDAWTNRAPYALAPAIQMIEDRNLIVVVDTITSRFAPRIPKITKYLAPLSEADIAHKIRACMQNNTGLIAEMIYGSYYKRSSADCLTEITALDLSSKKLSTLPPEISHLPNLQVLDLANNALTALPESVGKLVQLKELTLVENQLRELPESFRDLKNLEQIFLPLNRFNTIPVQLSQCGNLEYLCIDRNRLTSLPEWLVKLDKLKDLDVSDNSIDALPEWITQLPVLKVLYVGKNPCVEKSRAILLQLKSNDVDVVF